MGNFIKNYCILTACLLMAGTVRASVLTVNNWDGNNVSSNWNQWAVSAASNGNDIVYSWSRTGNLDGGTVNDTLSFDLRLKAWTGSSFDGTNVTLGTVYNIAGDKNLSTNAPNQHFGSGGDLDNNQSFQLGIENISFTQGEGNGWVAGFDGFSAVSRFAGEAGDTFYFGIDHAETITTTNTVANMPYAAPVQVLTVTATDNNNRFRDLDFSFTTTEPVLSPTASSFWFMQTAGTSNLVLNNGRILTNLNSAALSCVGSNDGGKLVYTVTWSGNDVDNDGTADTLSFDLLVEGFTNSTYSYSTNANQSSMTALGGTADATEVNEAWGVFGDADVDAGESLRFSVTNVQVSAPGYVGTFDGFTGLQVKEPGGRDHLLILGEGTGLAGKEFDAATATYTFPAVDRFIVTGAGSFYDYLQWAVSEIHFKISVENPATSNDWDPTDYSDYVVGPMMADEYPAQESYSNYPAFSWDTVPRWLIIRKGSPYTESEVNSMATNYNLIVWEKANGAGFGSIEEGILDTSARIRAVDPSTKNIFYFNSWVHYGGYAANAIYEPYAWEWSNHTTDTNGQEVIYMFKDRYYTHNYSVPGLRNWWVDTMMGMATNDVIDGVFIDKVTQAIPSAYDEYGQPVSDYLTMLDQLDQALPEGKLFLGNTLRNERNYGGRAYMELQDGSYFERWALPNKNAVPAQSDAEALAVTLQLMREGVEKGKIMLFKTGAPDGYGSTQAHLQEHIDWPLALYLIVAETNAYFAYQGGVDATDPDWLWDTSWLPEFNRPLGAPLNDPVKDGFVYTRSYQHVDVWVDLETEEAVLAWDNVDTDSDGLNDLWEYRNFGNTTNAAASANPDGDALNNLGEYALGGNPTNGADVGYLPMAGTSVKGGTNWFEYIHARRKDSSGELGYALETTSNLISNDWSMGSYITLPATGNLDPDYESVTNRIDTTGKTNEFVRLKIEVL